MTVRWISPVAAGAVLCPVCGSDSGHEVLETDGRAGHHIFIRCASCRSFYPRRPVELDEHVGGYAIGRAEHDLGLKHYVEVGAGLDSLLAPVLSVAKQPRGSLLDVGCGFGFLVAAWNILGQGEAQAHGIELASYGHWGRELLNLDISHELLHENRAVAGRKFDFVYSAEVVEHVAKPREFLAELAEYLADDGVLILTTPDAECVSEGQSNPVLLAALSPGAHQFVIAREPLEAMLRDAGFSDVRVEQDSERLIAWAARRKLPPLHMDRQHVVTSTQAVLASLAQVRNEWVQGGACYRLFRESVNRGDYTTAVDVHSQIVGLIERQIGPAAQWNEWISSRLPGLLMADELIAHMPCYLGNFLYYQGMLELNHFNRPAEAIANFQYSLVVNRHWVHNCAHLAQEAHSLLTTGAFHLDLALSRLAQHNFGERDYLRSHCKADYKQFSSRWLKELRWPQLVQ